MGCRTGDSEEKKSIFEKKINFKLFFDEKEVCVIGKLPANSNACTTQPFYHR